MDRTVHSKGAWKVKHGRLQRQLGRPGKLQPLFKVIGEKIPFEALNDVFRDLRSNHPDIGLNGILVNEREVRRTFVIYAEPWVAASAHPFVVIARREGKNTEHAAKAVILKVGGK